MTLPPEISPVGDQLAWVRAQEERTHRQRRITNWIVVGACLATLGIVSYDHVDLAHRVNTLTGIVNRVTGPAAVKANQQAAVNFENRIIICEDNHTDRRIALIRGAPVPPRAVGCPQDGIR